MRHSMKFFTMSDGGALRDAASTLSPATTNAGVSPSGADPAAGECAARPRSKNILAQVKASDDVVWLKSVLGSDDYQLEVRYAAQRRLGQLVRKPKL